MKLVIYTISIFLAIFIYLFSIWLDRNISIISQANKKYIRNIRKTKKIQKIDDWIRKDVAINLKILPIKKEDAELNLINFFDRYSKPFSFSVEKYIYYEKLAKHLEVKFILPRDDKKKLEEFFTTTFPNGYLSFKTLKIGKDMTGYLDIIQPINEEKQKEGTKNAIKQ